MESDIPSGSYARQNDRYQDASFLRSALHTDQSVQQLPASGLVHQVPVATQHQLSSHMSRAYTQTAHMPILQASGLLNILPPAQAVSTAEFLSNWSNLQSSAQHSVLPTGLNELGLLNPTSYRPNSVNSHSQDDKQLRQNLMYESIPGVSQNRGDAYYKTAVSTAGGVIMPSIHELGQSVMQTGSKTSRSISQLHVSVPAGGRSYTGPVVAQSTVTRSVPIVQVSTFPSHTEKDVLRLKSCESPLSNPVSSEVKKPDLSQQDCIERSVQSKICNAKDLLHKLYKPSGCAGKEDQSVSDSWSEMGGNHSINRGKPAFQDDSPGSNNLKPHCNSSPHNSNHNRLYSKTVKLKTCTCESSIGSSVGSQVDSLNVHMGTNSTATTSVHTKPIQSFSSAEQNSQRPVNCLKHESVPVSVTHSRQDLGHTVSKTNHVVPLLKDLSGSNAKFELTALDVLNAAKIAHNTQKAHLDAIKKTLACDLKLIQEKELCCDSEADEKQKDVDSSQVAGDSDGDPAMSESGHSGQTSQTNLIERGNSALNVRLQTLDNLSVSQAPFRSNNRSQVMAVHRAKMGSISNPAKSLDLLRQNLQKFINSELDSVVQKYVDVFFRPAIDNIRKNSGLDAVSDTTLIMLCAQMLEEAKKLYISDQHSEVPEGVVFDPGSKSALQENEEIRANKHSLFRIKRRGSSDSDLSITRKRVKKAKTWFGSSGRSTPSKKTGLDTVKKEGPKWDSDRLTEQTEFVMGSKANKALGLGNMRGRLYVKHPELFKYIGDADDKQWLSENGYMPSTGGKAYLLVLRDIADVAETEEYRNSNCLQMDELSGFAVPGWMIEKMKTQMKSQTTKTSNTKNRQVADQETYRLPFSSAYSGDEMLDSKSDFQGSPATIDQIDMMSVGQEELDTPAVSPFNMTEAFSESSPLTSDLAKIDDEDSLIASFDFQ